jgi:Bacterial pre-peptidase C-terminal domain
MRRSIATVGAVVLGLVALTPGASPAAPLRTDPGLSPADQASVDAGLPVADKAKPGARPAGVNPFLALLPDAAKADYSGWATYMQKQAAARSAARLKTSVAARPAVAAAAVVVDEDEPDGTRGSNEDPASAQLIKNFGTGSGQNAAIRVLGSLDPETATAVTRPANPEDDGSIPLAGATGVGAGRRAIVTQATIGDGPHGSAGTGTNDFDFYSLQATAGQVVTVQTATPTGLLDTLVALYTPDGTVVATNDDSGGSFDSLLKYEAPATGTYYAVVAAYSGLPADPFDPASGDGGASEGPYTVTISALADDQDFFAVKLRAGDVLGASVKGAPAYLTVYDTTPREVHGSDQDASFVYPMDSPLPGGGNAATDYVATRTGWHYVGVARGEGSYDITVEAYRPVLQGAKPVQTLFLDFDGGRVNTGVFGGTGNVTLSPFSAFLAKWGISSAQEDAVIDAVVAGVTENIRQDLIDSGLNARFRLRILNSKDHADPGGQANVSRIIVGGTIAESGVDTIGIAQSIDPGNFETAETALVLQDVLSEPAGEPASLNTYLTEDSDRVAFVGRAVGNVTAHEAGHFFGDWHTDNADDVANLMDSGGDNFDVLFGVGPDHIGGTADDPDVDFGDDRFSPDEGFIGTQDTLGRIVFGVTS